MFASYSAAWESRWQHLCVFPPTSAWLYGCWSIEHMLRHRSQSPCRLGQLNQTILRGFPLPSHYTSFPLVYAIAPTPPPTTTTTHTHPTMTTSSFSRGALVIQWNNVSSFWEGFLFVIAATNSNKIRGDLEWRYFSDFYLFSDGKSSCNGTGRGVGEDEREGKESRDENPRGEISRTNLSTMMKHPHP